MNRLSNVLHWSSIVAHFDLGRQLVPKILFSLEPAAVVWHLINQYCVWATQCCAMVGNFVGWWDGFFSYQMTRGVPHLIWRSCLFKPWVSVAGIWNITCHDQVLFTPLHLYLHCKAWNTPTRSPARRRVGFSNTLFNHWHNTPARRRTRAR